ncbi:MAG: GTPase ObgE [Proteobacteria bacterium]|nr:GTPase ObgE [Pseudomonadota bacterium]
MRFIDEARINVIAGDGGRGCVSFRREKYIPRGGPDGGDGGKGGNAILFAKEGMGSLIDFRYKRNYKAKSGTHGKGKNQHGKNGEDLAIPVPLGTLVRDDATGELLKDFSFPGEQLIVAKGGLGGRGNARFTSSTRQAPRYAQKGQEGEERWFKLELKLLADVGIIGLPNSGKSTLVSVITAAKPKIANYPFTTLNPCLGVVRYGEYKSFVVADIPGLIEGAHQGSGLGTTFLRHIERTRVLIHLIDGSNNASLNPVKAFKVVNNELKLHNPALTDKPQLIAINKMDLPESRHNYPGIEKYFEDLHLKVYPVSAATGEGIKLLINQVVSRLSLIDS